LLTTVQSVQRPKQTKHLLLRLPGVVSAASAVIATESETAIAARVVVMIETVLVAGAMMVVVRKAVGAMVREVDVMIVTGVAVVVAGMIEIIVAMTVVAETEVAAATITFALPKT